MPFEAVLSGLGLSGAAGLNAYVPLLLVATLGRLGWIQVAAPFEPLTTWWAIAALSLLLIVEVVVDKVPGADHVNDVVQTFVRPAAGSILFASSTGFLNGLHPSIALIAGLLFSFGVHATKTVARPVVTASTAGLGTPVVSALEDGVALGTSLLALFVPLVVGFALLLFVALAVWVWRAFRRTRLS